MSVCVWLREILCPPRRKAPVRVLRFSYLDNFKDNGAGYKTAQHVMTQNIIVFEIIPT